LLFERRVFVVSVGEGQQGEVVGAFLVSPRSGSSVRNATRTRLSPA